MSLRDSLRQSVATTQEKCCTVAGYRGCNNATNKPKTATPLATRSATTLLKLSNDAAIAATTPATTLQQALNNRATNAQQAGAIELQRLVLICGQFYGFTEIEHTDALAVAMADFNSAMKCFSTMEREIHSGRAKR